MKYTITFALFVALSNASAQTQDTSKIYAGDGVILNTGLQFRNSFKQSISDSTEYTVTTADGASSYTFKASTFTTETYYAKGLAVKVLDWDLGTLEYIPVSVKRTYTVQNLVTIVSTVTEIQDKEGNYLDANDFVTIYEEKKKLSIK